MLESFFENTEDTHGRSTVPYVMEGLIVALFGIPTAIVGIIASNEKDVEKIKQLHSYFTILVCRFIFSLSRHLLATEYLS